MSQFDQWNYDFLFHMTAELQKGLKTIKYAMKAVAGGIRGPMPTFPTAVEFKAKFAAIQEMIQSLAAFVVANQNIRLFFCEGHHDFDQDQNLSKNLNLIKPDPHRQFLLSETGAIDLLVEMIAAMSSQASMVKLVSLPP